MHTENLTSPYADLQKLLGMASGDAALLYLYLQSGGDPARAAETLHLQPLQLEGAMGVLRQLGLWLEQRPASFRSGEQPRYDEADVEQAMNYDGDFRSLYGEIQRVLGRTLNTEELKILLGFNRYLGLSNEVISMLVSHCVSRNRERGNRRPPSLRTIEKEAYAWAEKGIDTVPEAAAYMRSYNLRNSQLEKLKRLLQIRGRNLTPGEERYADSWLSMGFEEGVLALAYEKTCLNTGGLNWAYMNKILTRWHQNGLHTLQAVKSGDRKTQVPKGASGELGAAELEAIARIMQEG